MLGYHVRQLGNGLGDNPIVGTIDYDPATPGGYVMGELLNSPANVAAGQRSFQLMLQMTKPLPACTGQDCTLPEYRGSPNLTTWWMPAGAVRIGWGLWATVFDFREFNASAGIWTKTYKSADLPANVNAGLLHGLRTISGVEFKKQIQNWPSHPKDSVNHFIAAHPEFAYEYNGYRSEKYPTSDELNNPNGMQKFMARGGLMLSKKVIDGQLPMRDGVVLRSCLKWCRGCVSSSFPDGVMTCAQGVEIDPERRRWDLYIQFGPYGGKYTAILKREPDRTTTIQKIVAPVVWLLENSVGKIAEVVCGNIDKPEAQAGAAVVASSYPASAPMIAVTNAWMRGVCSPVINRPSTTLPTIEQPTTVQPTPPPSIAPPWYKTNTGMLGLAVGGSLVGGLTIFAIVKARRR